MVHVNFEELIPVCLPGLSLWAILFATYTIRLWPIFGIDTKKIRPETTQGSPIEEDSSEDWTHHFVAR